MTTPPLNGFRNAIFVVAPKPQKILPYLLITSGHSFIYKYIFAISHWEKMYKPTTANSHTNLYFDFFSFFQFDNVNRNGKRNSGDAHLVRLEMNCHGLVWVSFWYFVNVLCIHVSKLLSFVYIVCIIIGSWFNKYFIVSWFIIVILLHKTKANMIMIM